MFVIILAYKKPLASIEEHLVSHREFLDDCYQQNYFITGGPMNPRTGGIILSQLKDKEKLISILKQDPFAIHDLVTTQIIEFNPIKYHPDFAPFMTAS